MTDRLKIYNGALLICKQRKLDALTDNVESRHVLDEVWNDGGVDACLSEAQWKFATRAVRITYETSVDPPWGHQRAFLRPDDWISTVAVCSDEFFKVPLLEYVEEGDYWYASIDDIYVRYVSNDSSWGTNYGEWPSAFTQYVKAYFAWRIIGKLAGSGRAGLELKDEVKKVHEDEKLTAKNRDAMRGPTQMPARGSWVLSRRGRRGYGPMGDGGVTGSLTG